MKGLNEAAAALQKEANLSRMINHLTHSPVTPKIVRHFIRIIRKT